MKRLVLISFSMFLIPTHPHGQGSYISNDTASIKECIAENLRKIDSLKHEIKVSSDLLQYQLYADSFQHQTIVP